MTTTPDFRALCAELVDEIEGWIAYGDEADCADAHAVVDRARIALATPPPGFLRPIPVSERLPGPGDANEEDEVWVGEPFRVYQSQNTGEIEWAPRRFTLRRIDQYDAKNGCTWLPYNALPLPEVAQ